MSVVDSCLDPVDTVSMDSDLQFDNPFIRSDSDRGRQNRAPKLFAQIAKVLGVGLSSHLRGIRR